MKKFTVIFLIFVLSTVSVFATETTSISVKNKPDQSTEAVDETITNTEPEEPQEENISSEEADTSNEEQPEAEMTLQTESTEEPEETEQEEAPQIELSAVLLDNNSVKLSWTMSTPADTFYTIKKISTKEETFQTTKTEMIFNNLDVDELYTFKVIYKETEATTSIRTSKLQTPSLSAYAAYKGISLEWSSVPNAVSYEIYRDGSLINRSTSLSYYDKTNSETALHSYYIMAVAKNGKKSAMSNTVSKSPVRPMYITVVFKKKVKLTSHDGRKVRKTFKAGQKVTAHGYGSGKYQFYYNGNLFHAKNLRVKNANALYTKSFNYSNKDAEAFIKSTGKTSPTPWLIWVSEYTQHVYIFKRVQGTWKVYDSWEIASGKASTPSPKGFSKKINKKIKSRHGLGPWSCYSSMNAFHGKRKNWKVGKPASNGCVRNPTDKARWIYKNIPLRTKVIIY